jgi:hypothetical protein
MVIQGSRRYSGSKASPGEANEECGRRGERETGEREIGRGAGEWDGERETGRSQTGGKAWLRPVRQVFGATGPARRGGQRGQRGKAGRPNLRSGRLGDAFEEVDHTGGEVELGAHNQEVVPVGQVFDDLGAVSQVVHGGAHVRAYRLAA